MRSLSLFMGCGHDSVSQMAFWHQVWVVRLVCCRSYCPFRACLLFVTDVHVCEFVVSSNESFLDGSAPLTALYIPWKNHVESHPQKLEGEWEKHLRNCILERGIVVMEWCWENKSLGFGHTRKLFAYVRNWLRAFQTCQAYVHLEGTKLLMHWFNMHCISCILGWISFFSEEVAGRCVIKAYLWNVLSSIARLEVLDGAICAHRVVYFWHPARYNSHCITQE